MEVTKETLYKGIDAAQVGSALETSAMLLQTYAEARVAGVVVTLSAMASVQPS